MRFYDLTITDPATGKVLAPSAIADGFTLNSGGTTFTSYANGQTIPGALNIELDIPSAPFNAPRGQAFIKIWGVGLGMIGQASDLNGLNITLRAGMQKGLPLATAAFNAGQTGLILQGTIFQAFGNWQGVNQTIDLVCNSPADQEEQDIMLDWKPNVPLQTALTSCLQQAFAKYSLVPKVSIGSIIQPSDGSGHYTNLSDLAEYLNGISQMIGASQYGPDYSGVQITVTGNTLYAYDSVKPLPAVQLVFQDLIGQPTWLNPGTLSFKTVLRSDITIGMQAKFPTGFSAPYALTNVASAAPNAPSRSKSVFKGTFNITEVHHFGNFRQADGDSWNTSFVCAAVPPSQ